MCGLEWTNYIPLSSTPHPREKIDDSSIPIHIYNRNSSENQTLQSHNALFVYFQLFIDALFQMTNTGNDQIKLKQDFIKICQDNYQENQQQITKLLMNLIKHMWKEKLYGGIQENHVFINKALRLQDISTLFLMRFVIKDLHDQLLPR